MDAPTPPWEWLTPVGGFLVWLGWAKKTEGWAAVKDLATSLRSKSRGPSGRFSLNQVRAIRQLSLTLRQKLAESNGVRVNAICLHNGGSPLGPDVPKYLTVYDSQDSKLKVDAAAAWQRVPLSEPYDYDVIRPMLSLGANVVFFIVTSELSEDNYLKAHYETDGVTWATVCMAKATKKSVWYVSINYRGRVPEEGTPAYASARSVTQRMATRLADYSLRLPDPSEMPVDVA